MPVSGMNSNIIRVILVLMLSLPIFASGDGADIKALIIKEKQFRTAEKFALLVSERSKSVSRFSLNGVTCFGITETVPTKSGTVTYLAVYDGNLKIVHFTIPAFRNTFNATLVGKGFTGQFRNKQPTVKPIRRGSGVDAVSGATLSTESLISAVNSSAKELARMVGVKR